MKLLKFNLLLFVLFIFLPAYFKPFALVNKLFSIIYLLVLIGWLIGILYHVTRIFSDDSSSHYIKRRIYVRSSDFSDFYSLVNYILEKIVFLKFDSFKNTPSGNFLWLISFVKVTCVYAILFIIFLVLTNKDIVSLLKLIQPDHVVEIFSISASYFILINTSYAFSRKTYSEKWEYLAGLYNNLILLDDKKKKDLINVSLCMDIVCLEMWGHYSYQEIVYDELCLVYDSLSTEKSVDKNIQKEIEAIKDKFPNKDDYVKTLEDRKKAFSEKTILTLLEFRQEIILKKLKKSMKIKGVQFNKF